MAYTIEEMIAKRIAIRTYLEKRTSEFEEELKPYHAAATALEGAVTQKLLDDGVDSFKTPSGTAYRSKTLNVKVANRDLFIGYIKSFDAWSMIANIAVKEAVKEYMEAENGASPPGVEVTYFHKTNFRSPA